MSPSQEEGEWWDEEEEVVLGVGSDKRQLGALFVAGGHARGEEEVNWVWRGR